MTYFVLAGRILPNGTDTRTTTKPVHFSDQIGKVQCFDQGEVSRIFCQQDRLFILRLVLRVNTGFLLARRRYTPSL